MGVIEQTASPRARHPQRPTCQLVLLGLPAAARAPRRSHEKKELISDIWGKRGATYGEKGACRRINLVAADEVSRQLLGRAPRELLADDHIRAVGAFNVDAAEIT